MYLSLTIHKNFMGNFWRMVSNPKLWQLPCFFHGSLRGSCEVRDPGYRISNTAEWEMQWGRETESVIGWASQVSPCFSTKSPTFQEAPPSLQTSTAGRTPYGNTPKVKSSHRRQKIDYNKANLALPWRPSCFPWMWDCSFLKGSWYWIATDTQVDCFHS